MEAAYDALLLLSFGGPECQDDVMPFLRNVVRGRNVPDERLQAVAHHYEHFGGKSPINDQNRELLAALQAELTLNGPNLPVYWGNRNWHPLLADTLKQMSADGVRRALAFVTSAYSSYSGCRQYLENIEGASMPDLRVDKIRVFYNHPDFIEANAERVKVALEGIPPDAVLLFTAHSVPLAMAENCRYVSQLEETGRLVAEKLAHSRWKVVYQSRSGPPTQPWLEPDVLDSLRALRTEGVTHVVLSPLGFVSDHVEVLYDLDIEARDLCRDLGLTMVRAQTVGTHPAFVRMVGRLVRERVEDGGVREAVGVMGPNPDACLPGCCPSGRPAVAGTSSLRPSPS